eukprot:1153790-Pelagomonas_calceolata.AAC.1
MPGSPVTHAPACIGHEAHLWSCAGCLRAHGTKRPPSFTEPYNVTELREVVLVPFSIDLFQQCNAWNSKSWAKVILMSPRESHST